MKNLLPFAVISSFFACNPNTNDPDNSINEQQRMIYETRPHINKEENTIVTEKGDTLKGWRNKDPKVETRDSIYTTLAEQEGNKNSKVEIRDSIYTTLAEQEGKIKENSQTVTIDGIKFSITVKNNTVVFKCSNINKIGKKYMNYDYPKLKEFYIARRKGRLSNRELKMIEYYCVKELLQRKTRKLKKEILQDFQKGQTLNKKYVIQKIKNTFECFNNREIYYQTNHVPKRQNNEKKY